MRLDLFEVHRTHGDRIARNFEGRRWTPVNGNCKQNLGSSYPRLSVFIGGQFAFFAQPVKLPKAGSLT
jgi:hypothetical protein